MEGRGKFKGDLPPPVKGDRRPSVPVSGCPVPCLSSPTATVVSVLACCAIIFGANKVKTY